MLTVLGFMTGTSLDAVDMAILETDGETISAFGPAGERKLTDPGFLVSGGMLILDDYEWSGVYRTQKAAEDPWFERRGYRVMPLPTGQGLVFKR